MQAYCSVSFALKLAAFCLLVGVVVGAWLSAAVWSGSAADSQPSREPTTQVAEVLPGTRK
jgi:hypothetical protein